MATPEWYSSDYVDALEADLRGEIQGFLVLNATAEIPAGTAPNTLVVRRAE